MNDKPILILGASSDIGTALVRRLGEKTTGAPILAHCNKGVDVLDGLKNSLRACPIKILQADFTSAASVASFGERVAAEFGEPGRIVCLPGMKLIYERFSKFDMDRFDADMNIQVRTPLILLRRFAPAMAKLPAARIVFLLSSVTRGVPPRFMAMYTIVKHAQLGIVRALASEYSSSALTVNAVSPGMVETKFLSEIPDVAKQMAASQAPRGRIAAPSDVVGAIDFLLSEEAGFITGAEIPVTGGS